MKLQNWLSHKGYFTRFAAKTFQVFWYRHYEVTTRDTNLEVKKICLEHLNQSEQQEI